MTGEAPPGPWDVLECHWPAALRAVNAYLPFRLEPRRTGRLGKRPCRVAGGRLYPVDSGDPRWRLPFGDALALWRAGRCAGIGLALDAGRAVIGGLPLVAVDIDDALVNGTVDPVAQRLLDTLGPTYTEVSVSGSGLHALALGTLPVAGRRGAGLELISAGYVTCSGRHLPGSPSTVEPRRAGLRALHALVTPHSGAPGRSEPQPPQRADAEVLRLARHTHGAYFAYLYDAGDLTLHLGDHSRADLALARLLAQHTADPAQLERLLHGAALYRPARWIQRVSRTGLTYGARTIATALQPLPPTYHTPRTPR
ncbi:hypothetical protein E7T09_01010 [Deinococcus sp. KSM4-11]|uniref:phage NrS-1 polymerase family protein n=1 Tax=Deinococcus sp. KSM4-11 TaxID=2568654 RepID=UPI0010A54C5F|nr:hypothetical protein [Deinococcus sp. KSM4-11]THF87848.1 hypothetical protein E7T09_01010 [Deinococcus sp. KSM4-11]